MCSGRFWPSDNTIVLEPIRSFTVNDRFVAIILFARDRAICNRHRGVAAQRYSHPPLEAAGSRILPPLSRRSAGSREILGAYDDLIENNTRRIAILEEMAQRLYEEWFVRFRFPGHEQARLVDSPLGPIPERWEVTDLGTMTSFINRGLAPRYDEEGGSLIINQRCIRNQRLDLGPARRQSKAIPSEKLVCFGDVLVNSTGVGTLGRVAQVYDQIERTTVDSHVTIVRPKATVDLDFFGLLCLSLQQDFEVAGVGSTGQTELSRARIAEARVVFPPEHERRAFGKLVRPMRMLAVTLARQNRNLRTQRDLLLPKLISGEIDVSEAPSAQEVAAA